MNVGKNILATLAYYDVFDWPLRPDEIAGKLINFNHLAGSSLITANHLPETAEIQKELDQLMLDGVIDCAGSLYFLKGREYLVPLRLKREKIAKRKWRLARRAVWWLRFVPYIRAVFASGSLAMNNTDELSDLDVLIVVKHGRIWLARFLVLVVLSLLGIRRKASDKIAPDKICPNHFITDGSLRVSLQSIYTAQTYANLVPIYISDPALIKKFQEANKWVFDYVVNWNFSPASYGVKSQPNKEVRLILRSLTSNKLAEWFFDISGLGRVLGKILRRYQSERISQGLTAWHSGRGHVIFNDGQLAFHPHSQESEIIEKYRAILKKLELF